MNSSFLYQEWGLCSFECSKVEYDGKTIILDVQSKKRLFVCPKCGKPHLVKNVYCVSGGVPIITFLPARLRALTTKKVMKRNAYGFRDEMYFI